MTIIRFVLGAAVVLCFLAIVADWATLRWIGEAWWPTTVLLYLPQLLLLVPVVVLALIVALIGPRTLLLLHAVSTAILVFPVLGLSLAGPQTAAPGAPRLRLLSFNVDSGGQSVPQLLAEIDGASPDIVVLQESTPELAAQVAARLPGFSTHESTQFFVASRWPIVDAVAPPKVAAKGVDRSPRFMKYTIDSALGPIDVYNVHPISPREGFEELRGHGLLTGVKNGDLLGGDHRHIEDNTALRRVQLEGIAALAATSKNPVVIAGDTNSPGASRMLTEILGRYQDGFDAAGRGLGYTYPAHKRFAWMRIDRVLAGPELRFLDFQVGTGHGSDHYCVWADLTRR
jgi:endonuclease/exonuclease/phosphatase (EEP) superfamily protein YafD